MCDHDVEIGARLMAMVDSMPKRQRRGFRPAAVRAPGALKRNTPALVAATPAGAAGLYPRPSPDG
jgi:hypothetical protein